MIQVCFYLQERAIENRMESSPVPNWAWQLQSPYNNGSTLIPPNFSAAPNFYFEGAKEYIFKF
jgi:hypothetical protein